MSKLPLFRIIARPRTGFEGVFVNQVWWSSKVWADNVELSSVDHARLSADYRLVVEPMPAPGNQARIDASAVDTAKKLDELQSKHEQLEAEHRKLIETNELVKTRLLATERDAHALGASDVGKVKEEAELLRTSLQSERDAHTSLRGVHQEIEVELHEAKKRLDKYEDENGEPREQELVNGPPEDPADAPVGKKKGR